MRTLKLKGIFKMLITIVLLALFIVIPCEAKENIELIKVGLISVYQNVEAVKLSSVSGIMVGYYTTQGFDKIGTLPANSIKVKKAKGKYSDLGMTFTTYQEAKDAANSQNAVVAYVQKDTYKLYKKGSSNTADISKMYVVLDEAGKEIFLFNKLNSYESALVFRGGDGLTTVGSSKKYRGAIGIVGERNITPYNVIPFEEYLYGVVPAEMQSEWPMESLKAQAVASRSLAAYQCEKNSSKEYHIGDTTSTQVYGGYSKEDERTNEAVDATAGEVVLYQGKVVEAFYHSTSGGTTENAKYVWGSTIPYTTGTEDTYETEPERAPWTKKVRFSDIQKCLSAQGVNIGSVTAVKIVSRTNSGRVEKLTIQGTRGSHTLTKEKIRFFFSSANCGSLPSRLFSFNKSIHTNGISGLKAETVTGDFTIYGKGNGHGVGMSQSGAKGMAKAGFSYKDILNHYFNGITIE